MKCHNKDQTNKKRNTERENNKERFKTSGLTRNSPLT
jgi:hypothetical protein